MSGKVLMDLLRDYIWLWVILGMIFVSVVISLIFILINKCIYREGKRTLSLHHRSPHFQTHSNKYQERPLAASIPPLPPRTQFLTAGEFDGLLLEAQSYENLAEVNSEQTAEDLHDYEEATTDVHTYEQNLEELDYVKMEDEEVILPPPPLFQDPDPAADNTSMEDYDDIGGEDEEDYDDVA